MFDLEAEIIAGKSAAGLTLGQSAHEILTETKPISLVELEEGHKFLFPSVSLWIKQGVITQIGLYAGYQGSFMKRMRIGSTIAEVQEAFGTVAEDDEDNLIIMGYPGLCFETERWIHGEKIEDNKGAKIIEIYVYSGLHVL